MYLSIASGGGGWRQASLNGIFLSKAYIYISLQKNNIFCEVGGWHWEKSIFPVWKFPSNLDTLGTEPSPSCSFWDGDKSGTFCLDRGSGWRELSQGWLTPRAVLLLTLQLLTQGCCMWSNATWQLWSSVTNAWEEITFSFQNISFNLKRSRHLPSPPLCFMYGVNLILNATIWTIMFPSPFPCGI